MRFKMTVTMDDDALVNNPSELSRILHEVAKVWIPMHWETAKTGDLFPLYDVNGNIVGSWEKKG